MLHVEKEKMSCSTAIIKPDIDYDIQATDWSQMLFLQVVYWFWPIARYLTIDNMATCLYLLSSKSIDADNILFPKHVTYFFN